MNPYISDIIYCCEPFDRYHAFCDLQNLSQYNDGRIICPERVLASRWMWSVGKVRRYLEDLAQHSVIRQTKGTKQNIITLVDDAQELIASTTKEARAREFCDLVNSTYGDISADIRDSYINYWLDWSPRVNKYRFERTSDFDLSQTLAYWITNKNKFNNKSKDKEHENHERLNDLDNRGKRETTDFTIADLQPAPSSTSH